MPPEHQSIQIAGAVAVVGTLMYQTENVWAGGTYVTAVLLGGVMAVLVSHLRGGTRTRTVEGEQVMETPGLRPMNAVEQGFALETTYPPSMQIPACCHIINLFMSFEEMPEASDLVAIAREKLLLFPRFRSIPVNTPHGCAWKDLGADAVEVEQHVLTHAAVEGGAAGMTTALDQLCAQPLDRSRPRWMVHLLPAAEEGCEAMLVFRLNHAIADGRTIMTQVLPLFFTGKDGSVPVATSPKRTGFPEERGLFWQAVRLIPNVLHVLQDTVKMGTGSLESEVAGTLPRETREKGCVWPSHGRRLHFWPALSLPFLKAVKAKVGGGATINDILLAALAGMFRRLAEKHGSTPALRPGEAGAALLRVALVLEGMPTTSAEEEKHFAKYDSLTNAFFIDSVDISPAVNATNEAQRVQEMHTKTAWLKNSVVAMVKAMLIKHVMPRLTTAMNQDYILQYTKRHAITFSNVAGPQGEDLFLLGKRVSSLRSGFFAQMDVMHVMGFGDKLFPTLVTDSTQWPEPDAAHKMFLESLAALGTELGVPGSPLFDTSQAPSPSTSR